MLQINVKVINHKQQRYNTIGDWIWKYKSELDPLVLDINVSNLGDDKMNALVAIHELVEAILCRFNDPEITGEEVDKFDMSHEDLEEPGESLKAPYCTQHLVASDIEKMIADRLKIDWKGYEKRIKEL